MMRLDERRCSLSLSLHVLFVLVVTVLCSFSNSLPVCSSNGRKLGIFFSFLFSFCEMAMVYTTFPDPTFVFPLYVCLLCL